MWRLLLITVGLLGLTACNDFFSRSGSGAEEEAVFSGRGPATQIIDLPEGTYFLAIELSGNETCYNTALGPSCNDSVFRLKVGQNQLVNHRSESWADVIDIHVGPTGHVPTRFPITIVANSAAAWQLRFTPKLRPTPTPFEAGDSV